MGYFDGLVDGSFKVDSNGLNLFYPYGQFGSGYVLESEQQKNKIRNILKIALMVTLPIIILVQITVGFWFNLISITIYYIIHYFYVKKITKNLQRSDEKLTTSEVIKNSTKSHNFTTLILLATISIAFTLIGFYALTKEQYFAIAGLIIGFFGLGSILTGYMIFTKIKNKSQDK